MKDKEKIKKVVKRKKIDALVGSGRKREERGKRRSDKEKRRKEKVDQTMK